MIIKEAVYVMVFATALFFGRFLAWLCSDELAKDRNWIYLMGCLMIILGFGFIIFFRNFEILALIFFYMAVVFSVMIYLSSRKKFIKNKSD